VGGRTRNDEVIEKILSEGKMGQTKASPKFGTEDLLSGSELANGLEGSTNDAKYGAM
jgi:hypothetical protein